MMIVDAIRSASSRHAIYFLVTAYIESLAHFERASGVPRQGLALPVAGRADLEERLAMLESHAGVPLEAIVPITELRAVLAGAIDRLRALDESATAPLMPARNDSLRSALSV